MPRQTGQYGSTRRQSHHSHISHRSADSIPPPDMAEIESRRPVFHTLFHWTLPRSVQVPLTCLSIGLSAVTANGVYCWPTYGPVVAKILELNGTQAQTIVVGGILGVYLMAAPLGALTDRYGPRVASLVSAVLSGVGYLSFALLLSRSTPETPLVHIWLTIAYFCIGASSVGAYFACLTCASLSFPAYPTLSLSLPLSLVGLSSLCLATFSSLKYFQTTLPSLETELDPVRFLTFLGILCPVIGLFSATFMRVLPTAALSNRVKLREDGESIMTVSSEGMTDDAERYLTMSQSLHLDERTPLLIGGIEAAWEEVEEMERGKDVSWTVAGMLRHWEGFWAFGIILALCVGPSETIIASIGSILTSLTPDLSVTLYALGHAPPNALALRNKHVQILSLTSTLSRLVTGVLADYLCPPAVAVPSSDFSPHSPSHIMVQKKPIRLYRAMFASICTVILCGVYAWSASALQSERGLWVLSGGVGWIYGALFTLTPSIISAHFGPTNFGLAWGMVSYFAALGSVLFSYLFALLSVAAAEETISPNPFSVTRLEAPVVCYGTRCFQPSLWVAMACAALSAVGFVFIARRWKV